MKSSMAGVGKKGLSDLSLELREIICIYLQQSDFVSIVRVDRAGYFTAAHSLQKHGAMKINFVQPNSDRRSLPREPRQRDMQDSTSGERSQIFGSLPYVVNPEISSNGALALPSFVPWDIIQNVDITIELMDNGRELLGCGNTNYTSKQLEPIYKLGGSAFQQKKCHITLLLGSNVRFSKFTCGLWHALKNLDKFRRDHCPDRK